jgi:hypothetical protein
MQNNTSGYANTSSGNTSMNENTTGDNNTAYGYSALEKNQTGNNNVAVGYQAGSGSALHNKSGGVFLGYQAGKNENSSDKLYIENSSSSTPLIGGDFAADEVYMNANVGIGTNTPGAELEVNGQVIVDGQIQITGGNPGTNKVLMSDASGLASWSAQGGGGGIGASMFTAYMNANNMFTPHADDCAGTDVFVPLFSGATVGFCMELNIRSLITSWRYALEECMDDGKRLPEVMEFQYACYHQSSLGINNMPDSQEWISNFPVLFKNSAYEGVAVPMSGGDTCFGLIVGWVGNGGNPNLFHGNFRCVR